MSPGALTVREARDRYLAAHGFTLEGYASRRFEVGVGRLRIVFPNPRWLHVHDLHHVASGYGTDLAGEAEISAYELRGGVPSALIALLCVGAMALALAISPRRVWTAWRRARGTRALYTDDTPYPALLDLPVSELRVRLGIPPAGWGPA